MFWRSLFSRPILWIFTLLRFAFNVLLLNAISSTVAPSLLIDHESGPAVDHIAFWAAGWLANHGDAAAAYDPAALAAVQSAGLGYDYLGVMPWFYPPLAQVLAQPFAYLSPAWSLIVWGALGLSIFTYAAWRILPDPLAVLMAVTFSAFAVLYNGQIGLFIAAIAGLCLLSYRRSGGGGGWLALLMLKPQTVFAIPLAMAFSCFWRPIVTACLAGAVLIAVSAAWLGVDVWLTFIGAFTGTVDFFLVDPARSDLWAKYASAYGVLLYNGAPIRAAGMAQAAVSLAVIAVATITLRRCGPTDAALAIIVYAAIIAAPRIFVYDLPLLAIGALFHARASIKRGWAWWEVPMFAVGLVLMETAFITVPQAAGLIAPAFLAATYLRHIDETTISRCN